jgi:LacI family transcriptional regulator
VILCNTDRQPQKQRLYLRTLLERRVDGILVAGGSFGRAEAALTAGRVPVVMIGRHPVRCPSVRIDNVAAAATVTEHLLALGHRRIACLSGPRDSLTAVDRVEGYRRTLRDAGLAVDHRLVVEVGFAAVALEWVVDRWFAARSLPSAVIAPNDQVAIGMIRALYERGLRVPEDVSVTGFDDTPVASCVVPSLTTMAVPMRDLGRVAVELLLALLEDARAESVVLPCTLRVRESTSVCRGRD